MALQQINGNQISTSTQALITSLQFLNTNSVLQLPTGTTAQRPTGVAYGTLRFNTTEDKVEVYVSNSNGQGLDGWTLVGAGGPHVGNKDTSYIRTNSTSIDENITIGPVANGGDQFTNGFLVGPVEIASGYTLTIENGATLYIAGNDEGEFTTIEHLTVYEIANFMSARTDIGATREHIVPYTFGQGDTSVSLNYKEGSIFWLTNLQNNFTINFENLPISQIGSGGVDNNKMYRMRFVMEQGSIAYRPNGTIQVNGSTIANVQWLNGSAPSPSANRRSIFDLTLSRVTTTNSSGISTTNWWAFGQMTEYV